MTGPAVPSAATGVGRANTDRILRMFARFTSVGYLAYLALLYPSITTTTPHMHRWWTPLAVVVVFGSGMLPRPALLPPQHRSDALGSRRGRTGLPRGRVHLAPGLDRYPTAGR